MRIIWKFPNFDLLLHRKSINKDMIKDDLGAVRHQMTAKEIDNLYVALSDFLADCTCEEVDDYRDAIVQVKTLLHKRMQNANY